MLNDLMDRAKAVLENHEINRVRIDLKENPANRVWLWGQGARPKTPSLQQRYEVPDGGVWATEDFALGLGKACGLEVFKDLEACVNEKQFSFLYFGASDPAIHQADYKTKIRLLEDFDSQVVRVAAKAAENTEEVRVLVTTDIAASSSKKSVLYDPVPFVISGSGVGAGDGAVFSEKSAAGSQLKFVAGHKLLEHFLKLRGVS